jgi:Ca2+-binding RTX toxin-like protein
MPTVMDLLAGREASTANINRAIALLYGNVGANLDMRDWSKIISSADPLDAAEFELQKMYQEPNYLLANAYSLIRLGYTDNQIALTYNQLSQRLTYSPNIVWATGTRFAEAASLPAQTLAERATNDQVAINIAAARLPTLLLSHGPTGFFAQSDLGERLMFADGTFIANLTSDINILLGELGAIHSGQIVAVSTEGTRSIASQHIFTLGTAGNDVYDAFGTGTVTQWIFTGAGNDTVRGGTAADIIYAGDGDDLIRAGQEDTLIDGGNGFDTLELSANFTFQSNTRLLNVEEIRLTAAALTLNMTGSSSMATLRGFLPGGNTIIGSNANDIIIGGNVADSLTGNGGDDTITGGPGNDIFNIDQGSDTVTDLEGSDIFVISSTASLSAILVQPYFATAASRNLGGNAASAVFTVGANATVADFSLVGIANPVTEGLTINNNNISGAAIVTGTSGNDIIRGQVLLDSATETLVGGPGADTITGGRGTTNYVITSADSIGTTAETIDNARLRDNQTITFGNGVDVIRGFVSGTHKLLVANPNNYLAFVANSNAQNLTQNNNYGLRGNYGANGLFTIGFIGGGDLLLVTNAAGADLDSPEQTAVVILIGTTSLVASDFINPAVNIVTTGSGDDNVNGSNFRDLISTGSGNDVVDARAGDDTIDGGAGDDIIFGGTGNDTIQGGDGNDSIDGGLDNDRIDGGSGADTIVGGEGSDSINGGEGADVVTGGAGNDAINLTENVSVADLVIVNTSVNASDSGAIINAATYDIGADSITGFNVANDILLIVASGVVSYNHNNPAYLALGSGSGSIDGNSGASTEFAINQLLFSFNDAGNFKGAGDIVLNLISTRDGTRSISTLSVTQIAGNIRYSISGNDLGNAIVTGALDDTILGGAGADSIKGGAGNDSMTGGPGADSFDITTTAADNDTITDWGDGEDIILGSAFAGQRLNVKMVDSSTTAFNAATAFATNGIVSVTGGIGNDIITGGAGDDTINGGDGDDTISGGAGADLLNGNNGADLFLFRTADIVAGEQINGGGDTDTIRIVTSTDFTALSTLTLTVGSIERIQITDGQSATFLGSQLTDQAISVNGYGAGGASSLVINVVGTTEVNLSSLTFGLTAPGTGFLSGTDTVVIRGDSGNNTIIGTSLADTIFAIAGTDNITGGGGADIIFLGLDASSADTVMYAEESEAGDTVHHFDATSDALKFGARVFDGGNFTSTATFNVRVAITTFGGSGTSIGSADLIVNNADSTVRSLAQIDTLLAQQNGTFRNGVLFVTDDGANTFVYFDANANRDNGGSDITLIATLIGIIDASTINLANFIIT